MKKQHAGFDYFTIEFTTKGAIAPVSQGDQTELIQYLTTNHVTDLLVFSHGWNTTIEGSEGFYQEIMGALRNVLNARPTLLGQRKVAILGIKWPSIKFEPFTSIAGGGLAVDDPAEDVQEEIDRLKPSVNHPDALSNAGATVSDLFSDDIDVQEAAKANFVDALRSSVDPDTDTLDMPEDFRTEDPLEIWRRLEVALKEAQQDKEDTGGALADEELDPDEGGAESLFSSMLAKIGGGIAGTAKSLLKITTFWQMKERAGVIGAGGVYSLLKEITEGQPALRLHFFGHSFGARLLTAAALGPKDHPALPLHTLFLVQGAFSHNAFSDNVPQPNGGFYRRVADAPARQQGPILISHTKRDTALGLAYPIGCRLSNDNAKSFGGPDDLFGAMGSNGAQNVPDLIDTEQNMLFAFEDNPTYHFAPGRIYNLKAAPGTIMEHSEGISSDAVALVFLSGIQAGGS